MTDTKNPAFFTPPDDQRWLIRIREELPYVLHRETQSIGKVKAVHGFNSPLYVSKLDGRPVECPVIELEDGTTLVARDPGAFLVMNETHARYSLQLAAVLETTLKGFAHLATVMGVPTTDALALIVNVFRRQANALDEGPKGD
jgi:hypothetical protein